DGQAEEVLGDLVQGLEAVPVGYMEVHGPTLQVVVMLVKPLIRVGDEACATTPAVMPGRSAFNHPPPEPRPGDDEIERSLHIGGWPDGPLLCIEFDVCARARRAFQADDHVLPAHPQLLVSGGAGSLLAGLPGPLPGPNIDMFPLVVETGATVDEG